MNRPELTLIEHFQSIQDYRENHNKRHLLIDIIVVAVCCVICGADNFVEIQTIANEKLDWLRTFLSLPNGIPSHDTFNRVFARIRSEELRSCFLSWVQATFPDQHTQHIALDGKELHHSQDGDNDFANLRMISAWSVDHGIVLGQAIVADDSNEITAVPHLLKTIDITGCHFTADAFHCQMNLVKLLTTGAATFTIGVKANQKTLYHSIVDTFADLKQLLDTPLQSYTTTEKGHGRLETRTYYFTNDLRRIATIGHWDGIENIGMVESERRIGNKIEQETRYYINRGDTQIQAFANHVRSHWSIENKLHWRLDVIFHEDGAHLRVDHAPENMAIIRHIAMNLLTSERTMKVGTQAKRLRAACSNQYLEKVIKSQNTHNVRVS
jgi:predicted transposase YbfD/YdcC